MSSPFVCPATTGDTPEATSNAAQRPDRVQRRLPRITGTRPIAAARTRRIERARRISLTFPSSRMPPRLFGEPHRTGLSCANDFAGAKKWPDVDRLSPAATPDICIPFAPNPIRGGAHSYDLSLIGDAERPSGNMFRRGFGVCRTDSGPNKAARKSAGAAAAYARPIPQRMRGTYNDWPRCFSTSAR
jgi:hypothetical protein